MQAAKLLGPMADTTAFTVSARYLPASSALRYDFCLPLIPQFAVEFELSEIDVDVLEIAFQDRVLVTHSLNEMTFR